MATRMQQRRGLALQWSDANPALAAGEIGFETDTNKFKIGDGETLWLDLPYFIDEDSIGGSLDGYLTDDLLAVAGGIATLDEDGQVPANQLGNATVDLSAYATTSYVDAAVSDLVDSAPGLLDTLNELAAAIGDDENFSVTVANLVADKQDVLTAGDNININGATISVTGLDTDDVQEGSNQYFTDFRAQEAVASNLGTGLLHASEGAGNVFLIDENHVATRTYAEGLANTAQSNAEATAQFYADNAQTAAQNYADGLAGNYDAAGSATTAYNNAVADAASDATFKANAAEQNAKDYTDDAIAAIPPVDISNKQDKVAGVSDAEIGYLDGVTSGIQGQIDAKASLDGANFTGNVEVDGNLVVDGNFTVNGTNFSASATSIVIEDNLVQLAHNNPVDTVDLGLVVGYNDGAAKHAGIVRDVSADKWKLFKGVTTEPTTTVDFTQGSLDDLEVAGLTASSATIGDVSNTELQYLNGVTSAIQTQIDAKAPLADPTFTGTVSGVTKAMVGLANVDNTSDVNKPVSTATQNLVNTAISNLVGSAPASLNTLGEIATALEDDPNIVMSLRDQIYNTGVASQGYADDVVSTHNSDTTNVHGIADTAELATKSYADTAAANAAAAIVDSAPAALNTLNELAAALGDDENFATTVTTALSEKAPLSSPTFTGTVDFSGATVTGIDALPDQTGNTGKYLTTDGTDATWTELNVSQPIHPFVMTR